MLIMAEPLQFVIIDRLGHGQFSTVYKAKWVNPPQEVDQAPFYYDPNGAKIIKNHQPNVASENRCDKHTVDSANSHQPSPTLGKRERLVALKRIELCDIQNSQARMDYLKEVKLLQQVKHPNIINFNISFIERNELYIVLELADGGDLSKLIKYFQRKKRLIPEQTILKYFTQVSSAVEYIHSKRILHRDIKPANIFMTSDGCVKLGDFGLGRFFSQNTRDAHSIVGTFYYMSPERIRETGYGFSSDVWSLGCVLYELITLNSPFSIFNQQEQQQPLHQQQVLAYNDNRSLMQQQQQQQQQQPLTQPPTRQPPQNNQYNLEWLFERITRADYPSLDGYGHISYTLRHLATQCLNPNPEARPNMQYICAVVYEAFRIMSDRLPLPTRPTQSPSQDVQQPHHLQHPVPPDQTGSFYQQQQLRQQNYPVNVPF